MSHNRPKSGLQHAFNKLNRGEGGLQSQMRERAEAIEELENGEASEETPLYKPDSDYNSRETLMKYAPDVLNMSGRTTHMLTVVREIDPRQAYNQAGVLQSYDTWLCRCRCGNYIAVSGKDLRKDRPQKSCGCALPKGHIHHRTPGSQTNWPGFERVDYTVEKSQSNLVTLTEGEYLARADEYLTASRLRVFLKSPAFYARSYEKSDDSAPTGVGLATHVLAFEPDKFNERFFTEEGPINPATDQPYGSTSKKYLDWLAGVSNGRRHINSSTLKIAHSCVESLRGHEVVRNLLLNGTGECTFENELRGVKCQARIDYCTPKYSIELKSGYDLDDMESKILPRVLVQVAFQDLVRGEDVVNYVVGVETDAPYRVGVWEIKEETINKEKERILVALDKLFRCKQSGNWPTMYESLRSF